MSHDPPGLHLNKYERSYRSLSLNHQSDLRRAICCHLKKTKNKLNVQLYIVNATLVYLHIRKSWRDIHVNVDDVYTRIYSSETTRPRPTIGTANNEWVHSFYSFLPNPFIEDLFFWMDL